MLKVQLLGAQVARYGVYGGDRPLTYEHGVNAGRAIEFVDLVVTDPETGSSVLKTMTLSPTINGSRPAEGTQVDVLALVTDEQKVAYRPDLRNGGGFREFVYTKTKWKALALQAASPPAESTKKPAAVAA